MSKTKYLRFEINGMKNRYNFVSLLGLTTIMSVGHALAQTGPGGVSAIGTATNLKLWLRADNAVFTNSGTTLATNSQPVQQWNDGSGNGAHGVNTNGTTRPTYTTAALNGMPTLDFAGASAQTLTAGVNIQPAVMPDVTVIAVAKSITVTNTVAKLWGHDAPTQSAGFMRGVGIDGRAFPYFSYFTGAGVASLGTISPNTYFINTSSYTTSTFNGFIDGASTASGAVSNTGGLTSLSIGSLTPTSEFWNGSIAEFIVYNKVLSEAERVLVENYLAAKYGLALTGIDYYAQDKPVAGNYDYDVAGIGAGTTGAAVTSGQGSGIVQVSAPSAMTAGEYLMFGHDNLPLSMSGPNRPAGYNSRLQRTWRTSETGEVGTMAVSFDLTGLSGIPASANDIALIIDRNNNGLFSDETPATTGVITGGNLAGSTVTFNGVDINNNQRFTLAFTNTVALPLDLLSFVATPAGGQNEIRWQTAQGKGIAALELEQSTDGQRFRLLQAVPLNNAGSYTVTDAQPAAISYYRLRIVDQDGSASYSAIEKVSRQNQVTAVRISPNPTTDVATITGLSGARTVVRVLDGSGRILSEQQISGSALSVSLAGLPAGTYFINVDAEGVHTIEQLVKQ
jgi:hypothetical protein